MRQTSRTAGADCNRRAAGDVSGSAAHVQQEGRGCTAPHLNDGLVAVVAHCGVVVHLQALKVLHQAALQVA